MPDGETFSPFINADIRTPSSSGDVLKKCALVALHLIAEEGRNGEGCHVPGMGDEWEMVCPKSPMWESGNEAWSEDETVSSGGSREGNVGNDALHVVGFCGPGDKMSLSLKDWELAKVHRAATWPWTCCARKCVRPVSGAAVAKRPLSQQEMPFSHRGRAVTKGEGCGERK